MTYIRKNAWNNGGDFSNADLYWYAKGVQKMMARGLDDPASWWFFAAMHGEYVSPNWGLQEFPGWAFIQAPPAVPTAPLPSEEVRDLYWNQCQHGTWYFLPWHRGYLYALEAQLRADIVSLGGPKDWALPYWNYFEDKQYRIPPAFAQPTFEDGQNPLFVKLRFGPDGEGGTDVYLTTPAWKKDHPNGVVGVNDRCLENTVYAGSVNSPGFGGLKSGFAHFGPGGGDLEGNPHNIGHVLIGGEPRSPSSVYGLMSDPGIAALDPIFYLHHCNIDRMWTQWNKSGNLNPSDEAWLKGPAPRQFVMPGQSGAPWYFTPREVASIDELGYNYDELPSVKPEVARFVAKRLRHLGADGAAATVDSVGAPALKLRSPELLGASATQLTIQGTGVRNLPIGLDRTVRGHLLKSFDSIAATSLPDRVLLELESVRGTRDATVVDVYLHGLDDQQPVEQSANLVGQLGLFGLRRASLPDGGHGGAGLSFVLDITEVVDQLHLDSALDVDALAVSLVPHQALPAGETITVGRVSVYRQAITP